MRRRVVCTGMAVITKLGDELDEFYGNLIEGRSGVGHWTFHDDGRVYCKVGGDLSGYDAQARLESLRDRVPEPVYKRARKLFRTAPFATRLSLLTSLDAWLDAGLGLPAENAERVAILVGGHNLNENYVVSNLNTFSDEPDWIDAQAAVTTLDTDHAGSVAEMLRTHGAQYTVGGACASASIAMRSALDEIRYHDHDIAVVTGAALDFSPMGLHAMALLGAVSFHSFNDTPEKASRPYDVAREGFIPSHGSACLILEELEHAKNRGATIYGELAGAVATSDACHLPTPSPEGQERTIRKLLKDCATHPEEVDFVSAHATSTPLGDLSELTAIRGAFGRHAHELKINAPKSMLGHTCWSAPAVETVAALLQMKYGTLHGSINIDQLDPQVDLDVCAGGSVEHEVRVFLKNSFGFGGTNCCSLWKAID